MKLPSSIFKALLPFLCFIPLLSISQVPQEQLLLWLRADQGITRYNDSVVSWNDCRKNSISAVCTTPCKPLFISQAANGLPALSFNGQNMGLQTPELNTFANRRGTVFAVVRVNGRGLRSSAGVGNIVSTYHGKGIAWQFCASPNGFTFYDGIGGVGMPVEKTSTNEWSVIGLVRNSDSLIEFYRNGRHLASITVNTLQPAKNTIKIGYNALQSFEPGDICEVLNGEIAEILVYNKALQGAQLKALQIYLCGKYSIQLLPAPFYLQWWFYCLLLLFFAITFLLATKIIQNRKMKKQLAQMKAEQEITQERIRISQDMHDELGAGLSKIRLLSELINNNRVPVEQLSPKLQTISETSGILTDNLKDLVWVMHPENNTLSCLVARIREYSSDYLEDFPIGLAVQIPDMVPDTKISGQASRNIYMIAKESLQNIVKHSGATDVVIIMSIEKTFLLSIKDNGKSFDAQNQHRGNGLKNMVSRSERLNARITIDAHPQRGTIIKFEVDLEEILK